MGYSTSLMDRHPNTPLLEIPYDYNYNLSQKRRGDQDQVWTSPQRNPQKTKFPYGITSKRVGRASVDTSGGSWYFEDELVMSSQGDKFRNNIFMDGYTGGIILMTKREASNMGLTPQQVINLWKEDDLFAKSAKATGTIPSLFFTYRSDGSISGKWKPPIIPPPAPATPPPTKTPPVAEPTPVGNLNPYQLKTTINPKWILLAIVGVGILSAMIFIMRGRK